MGDADEVSSTLKGPVGQDKAASVNIDLINLTCQLTSMGLRPDADIPGPSGRNAKKRVRFSIPDGEGNIKAKQTATSPNKGEPDETVPVGTGTVSFGSPLLSRMADKQAPYRHREVGEFLKAKRRFTNLNTSSHASGEKECASSSCRKSINGKVGIVASCRASTNGKPLVVRYMCDIYDDDDDYDDEDEETENEEPRFNCPKKRKRDDLDNMNHNCSTKGKRRGTYIDRSKRNTKGRSKSYEWVCKYKKTVVSKKSRRMREDPRCVRYIIGDKRKFYEILEEYRTLAKKRKRKISHRDARKRRKYEKSTKRTNSIKRQKLKSSNSKCSTKAFRAKLTSANAKRTRDRLKRAKAAAKRKRQHVKKTKEAQKKALKRKEELKRKLAQKRKANKKARSVKRRRAPQPKRPRKIRIKPIFRDDDVSENLRVNLLKFMTFESAYEYNLECCRKYCWDRWKELDMDDVLADFD